LRGKHEKWAKHLAAEKSTELLSSFAFFCALLIASKESRFFHSRRRNGPFFTSSRRASLAILFRFVRARRARIAFAWVFLRAGSEMNSLRISRGKEKCV